MATRWFRKSFDQERAGHAGRVVDEALKLSLAGRPDEAAETGERGLRMAREIAATSREQALPVLIRAVCGQSWFYAEVGRLSDALALGLEGLELAREAGSDQLLATALNTAASRLLESGRAQEALIHCRELVGLTGLRSDAWLARDLVNLAVALAATGRHAEALPFSEQALGMWRDLVAADPAVAASTEYGRTLLNHANRLFLVGRLADAVDAAAEAVAFHRAMPAEDRHLRLEKLSMALDNYATFLSVVRRDHEALTAAAESVALSRTLVADRPGHRGRLAKSLRTYAGQLLSDDQAGPAYEALAEAVALFRDLAAEEPQAYRSRLAEAVSDLAALAGDDEDGLAIAEEAVLLRREAVAANRGHQLPGLALSLANLAVKQEATDRPAAALESGDEAVRLIREAAGTNRRGVLSRYSSLLRRQAERLDRAGRVADARALGTEAIAVSREALETHRAANLFALADALYAQSRRFAGPGSTKQTRRQARELERQAAELLAELDAVD